MHEVDRTVAAEDYKAFWKEKNKQRYNQVKTLQAELFAQSKSGSSIKFRDGGRRRMIDENYEAMEDFEPEIEEEEDEKSEHAEEDDEEMPEPADSEEEVEEREKEPTVTITPQRRKNKRVNKAEKKEKKKQEK